MSEGEFYADGDGNLSFNPLLPEINKDGTFVILSKLTTTDSDAVFEFLKQSLIVYLRVDGRISLP